MAQWSAADIRALRERLGMSVGEFCRALECSENQSRRWEKGVTHPSQAYRRALTRLAASQAQADKLDAVLGKALDNDSG